MSATFWILRRKRARLTRESLVLKEQEKPVEEVIKEKVAKEIKKEKAKKKAVRKNDKRASRKS